MRFNKMLNRDGAATATSRMRYLMLSAVNLGVQPLFENAFADCFLTVAAPSRQ